MRTGSDARWNKPAVTRQTATIITWQIGLKPYLSYLECDIVLHKQREDKRSPALASDTLVTLNSCVRFVSKARPELYTPRENTPTKPLPPGFNVVAILT